MRLFYLLICGLIAPANVVHAADITHSNGIGNDDFIIIDGPIESGDIDIFRKISLRYNEAVVILNSDGGALLPAIEIGKIIKIAGYETVVPKNATCASSCALIWVAGSTRWLSPAGRVGFHASYRNNNGKPEESGVANALVGNYLTLLNFSENSIVFATSASPTEIRLV